MKILFYCKVFFIKRRKMNSQALEEDIHIRQRITSSSTTNRPSALLDIPNNNNNRYSTTQRSSMSHSSSSEDNQFKIGTQLPKLNIKDMLHQMGREIHEFGKRFIVIGLNYECHTCKTWSEFTEYVLMSNESSSSSSIPHVLSSSDPVWIDIQNPSNSDMDNIQRCFKLHPLTIEDCVNSDTGEKWEFFDEYMFVVFTAQVDDECLPPIAYRTYQHPMIRRTSSTETTLNVIVFNNYVITIHDRPIKGLDLILKRIEAEYENEIIHGVSEAPRPSPINKYDFEKLKYNRTPSRSHMSEYMDELSDHGSYLSDEITLHVPLNTAFNRSPSPEPDHQPNLHGHTDEHTETTNQQSVHKRTHIPSSDWILYAFLDALVDMYIPYVDALSEEVDNLEDFVFELSRQEQGDLVKRIGVAKRNIVTLRRLLRPKQKMTVYLVSQEIRFLSKNVTVYLRDVLDHLQICLEKLEDARENLNQTHSNYLTMVQTDIAEASVRTDTFMDRITVFAALWSPLTLISGLWGMNVSI
jgi:Mg2+ and Co2+ transporter CorA